MTWNNINSRGASERERERERAVKNIYRREKQELCVCVRAYRRVTSLLVVVFKRTDRAAMVVWVTENIFFFFLCVGVCFVSTSSAEKPFSFFWNCLGFEEKSHKP